jgi:AcrR family transcriptional regulator
MPRPKQRTPELRDRLLVAAVGALADDGVSGLTARRVASDAGTSVPAVYELFGDKAGLVRAVFFEGFRMLRRHLDATAGAAGGREAVAQVVFALRSFIASNPVLARVMFERPFADFDPGPEELAAGAAVREFIVDRVSSAADRGDLAGDPTDIAHVLIGLALGLAAQESAGWLGSTSASADRRWAVGTQAVLDGLAPAVSPP